VLDPAFALQLWTRAPDAFREDKKSVDALMGTIVDKPVFAKYWPMFANEFAKRPGAAELAVEALDKEGSSNVHARNLEASANSMARIQSLMVDDMHVNNAIGELDAMHI
jgi:hypothetical protein